MTTTQNADYEDTYEHMLVVLGERVDEHRRSFVASVIAGLVADGVMALEPFTWATEQIDSPGVQS